MRLRYAKKDGTQMEFELGDRPITIGRSPEADIVVLDEKASRLHCGIRLWDGEYYIKDLKSRNGTTLNGQTIEMAPLKPGDKIRIGTTTFMFEKESQPQPDEALREMQQAMEDGKGYSTILKEIVEEVEVPESPAKAAEESAESPPAPEPPPASKPSAPKSGGLKVTVPKPGAPKTGASLRIVMKKPKA